MDTLPAREFLERFVNAYGQTWEALFFDLTENSHGAKHMAEFIDDLERYGQQTPAYIDTDGLVLEGNRVALAMAVLNANINFTFEHPPTPDISDFWDVEFTVDTGDEVTLFNNLDSILSFRVEGDWVTPWSAGMMDGEATVVMHCPSGQYTADRLAPLISDRLQRLAGVTASGIYVCETVLDDEAAE